MSDIPITKVMRADWQPTNKVVILYGHDQNGKEAAAIAVPIGALPTMNQQARRFISGEQAIQDGRPPHAPWHYAHHQTAQTYNTGILPTPSGEKVSLILDRGLETEIGFAIEVEHARQLGKQLMDAADQATKTAPRKN